MIDQKKFIYKATEANTLIDSFYIIGANTLKLEACLPNLVNKCAYK
jgi:hypothetical protein